MLAATTLITPIAFATDYTKTDVRGETYCYPAKHAVKVIEQLSKVKDDKRNIVDVDIMPRFLIYDDGAMPDRYYILDNENITDFTINEDGTIPDFIGRVTAASKDADLCIEDKARAGLKSNDESLYFEMGLSPFFKTSRRSYTIPELKEGMQDGKAHYKAMIPATFRPFMPNTNCLLVKYSDLNAPPRIYAETADGQIALESEYYNEGYVIQLTQLEALNATALTIKGGDYKLAPVPSIATMKRFGVGRPRGPQKTANAAP